MLRVKINNFYRTGLEFAKQEFSYTAFWHILYQMNNKNYCNVIETSRIK